MKTEFKDVAHLYLGCKAVCIIDDACTMGDRYNHYNNGSLFDVTLDHLNSFEYRQFFKPILRKLSIMSEDEIKFYFGLCSLFPTDMHGTGVDWIPIMARCINYLRSIHIDCDNLIESGMAIDASTITPNPYKQS